MERIPEVEAAKALMNEAVSWSVMKWLREKKRVRKTADQANAALDQLNQAVKNRWPDAVRVAYKTLVPQGAGIATVPVQSTQPIDQQSNLSAKKVKEADDVAYSARMDAEETFDTAERQLSTRLAREGCRKAIQSWDCTRGRLRKQKPSCLRSNVRQRMQNKPLCGRNYSFAACSAVRVASSVLIKDSFGSF